MFLVMVLPFGLDVWRCRQWDQHFFMKLVATQAEVLIELARRQPHCRSLEKLFDRPAVRDAHAFGVAHRERFINRIADQPLQDGFQLVVEQIADGRFGFDAAGEDVALRVN